MKCSGLSSDVSDPVSAPFPRRSRSGLFRIRARPTALKRPAQIATTAESPCFWARGRRFTQLRGLLVGKVAVVSVWRGKRLVGFGRASSNGYSRALLWDVVVTGDLQGHGLDRRNGRAPPPPQGFRSVERFNLMTTNSGGFYRQLGFCDVSSQQLLVHKR